MSQDLILAACVTACRNALAGVDNPRSNAILEIVRSNWEPANAWRHWSEVELEPSVARTAMRLYAEAAGPGEFCPVCGAKAEFEGYQPGDLATVRENWGCNTCGSAWTEVFEYTRRECVAMKGGDK